MHCSLLHEIFEATADRFPDGTAVALGSEQVTYAALEARANRLAHLLQRRGVRPRSLVGLLMPRSIDAYAAMLAILKTGAAYVPIDPGYPDERTDFILRDSEAAALVTTAAIATRRAPFRGVSVLVDADRDRIEAASHARPSRTLARTGPQDLCYVIYTSGSTGRPKGVMIEHRNACHLVETERRLFDVRPEDRVYQGFSLSFDASVEEIWLAFRAGATLVAATPDMERAGPDLPRLLAGAGVTVLSCVPTLLSMLEEDIPTVRLLILGGEACPEPLVARWAAGGRRMVNTYGPTEATVIATAADLIPGEPVTIGRPIPGYTVRLLDDRLRPVAPGETGEICIGGAGLARGYVGPPEWTAARFVRDHASRGNGPDRRIYRSGDLGRLDPAGRLHFLGRRDAQVKLRGFRVELAEIESAIQSDGVKGAVCVVREDVPGVQQLVAYVVPRAGRTVDELRLRSRLRERLPAYMVPSRIETIAELPLLPSGKLDRSALSPPAGVRPAPPLDPRAVCCAAPGWG